MRACHRSWPGAERILATDSNPRRDNRYIAKTGLFSMPDLSVVVPVHNERDNVVPLLTEIVTALRGKTDFEIVYVDDCSRDDTLTVLTTAKAQFQELRV